MKLPDLIAKQAYLYPDQIALIDPSPHPDLITNHERGWRELTYAELNERASRLAEFLEQHWGVTAGTRVATLSHNRIEAVELLFACAKLGAVMVPLNWRLARRELDYVLRDASVRGILHDAEHAETAAAMVEMTPADEGSLKLLNMDDGYEAALATSSGELRTHEERDEDELWYLIYTSGTTGRPKGVIYTAGMALVNFLNIGIATELVRQDVFLSVLPQFHTGGWNLYLLPMMFLGGTTILPRTFDVDEYIQFLSRDATAFFAVPAVYQTLADHPDFATTDFSGMRSWAAGGAAMSVPLLRRLDTRGIQVRQGMGMTETGPTAFLLDADNAIRKAGSVGKPQLFVDVRIVDEVGRDVPTGERGELLFRGPGVTPGYWNDAERTEEAFYPGGWLRSGDIGVCDEEGFYYIVDRAKDMYISGGENVFPAEVETVILEVEGVRDAAVIGVEDERWGEVGKAILETTSGTDAQDLIERVRAHCREHLAKYKVPVYIEITDALPRNATGKVLKHELRAPEGDS